MGGTFNRSDKRGPLLSKSGPGVWLFSTRACSGAGAPYTRLSSALPPLDAGARRDIKGAQLVVRPPRAGSRRRPWTHFPDRLPLVSVQPSGKYVDQPHPDRATILSTPSVPTGPSEKAKFQDHSCRRVALVTRLRLTRIQER